MVMATPKRIGASDCGSQASSRTLTQECATPNRGSGAFILRSKLNVLCYLADSEGRVSNDPLA